MTDKKSEVSSEKTDVKKALGDYYSKREGTKIMDFTQKNPNITTVNPPMKQTQAMGEQSQVQVKPAPTSYMTNYDDYAKEVDTDLTADFDTVKLPSQGIFYRNKISEVVVEYLTSKDEDILTTRALVENDKMIDVLLRRKIKTKGIVIEEMLAGDKNAILVFLRASSYGKDYEVIVTDPFGGKPFKATIDLTKLKYKENLISPDENLLYTVELPMRKKWVKFRLINDNEFKKITKQAEIQKDATGEEFLELMTMRLKAAIVSIDGKTDRAYISKFVDAMPAKDSLTLRNKIDEVSPDVDFKYEFTSPMGVTFEAGVQLGVDFFYPKN